MSTPALRKYIEEHGGTVRDTREGIAASFPEAEPAQEWGGSLEEQIERAISRAQEFGTTLVRLWRERGDGYFACSSHSEHPGFSWVCRIDMVTGSPISCECPAVSHVCHHLGAAIAAWRESSGWAEADRVTSDMWANTLRMVQAHRSSHRLEEEA